MASNANGQGWRTRFTSSKNTDRDRVEEKSGQSTELLEHLNCFIGVAEGDREEQRRKGSGRELDPALQRSGRIPGCV